MSRIKSLMDSLGAKLDAMSGRSILKAVAIGMGALLVLGLLTSAFNGSL